MHLPGKTIGGRSYIHTDSLPQLQSHAADLVLAATQLLRARGEIAFNVVRIKEDIGEVAFLHYPDLMLDPFPSLVESWRVHPAGNFVAHRSFRESLNPPILHRTELLLEETNPKRKPLAELTRACEEVGLFDEPSKIGFKRQWQELVSSKGYEISGFTLVPVSNHAPVEIAPLAVAWSGQIARHLTALSRVVLSAPVQCLIRHNLLAADQTFFDYGCGKGDDMATLAAMGYQVSGWDPFFRPAAEKSSANVVNIGFVINVIEDREERVDALQGAYALATKVLAIASMTTSDGNRQHPIFGDGVLTSRNTFQKYFTQAELQQFIENVLGEDAYPAAPGVFYVFKDRSAEQQYLLARSTNRSRAARAQLSVPIAREPGRPCRPQRPILEFSSEQQATLRSLWKRCLDLGRRPEADEIEAPEIVIRQFRSLTRAFSACEREFGTDALQRARLGRRADISVMLALQFFGSRRPFTQLDEGFRRDLRALFGSYAAAESDARKLLFSVQDTALIRNACVEASTLGLGWLEPEHSLQLHTSLIERLDPALRVYVGCASALAGDVSQFDIAKIHIGSGKVTLMSYDDFVAKPLPLLQRRVKARLRDQELDVFEYGDRYPPTVLYMKSRYINEEFPHYGEQVAFDESLERLGLFDLNGYGDPEVDVQRKLKAHRWTVRAFTLARSDDIPNMDEKCGATFTYGQLAECGETWHRLKPPNSPRSAGSYNALFDLCVNILDPIVDYFGAIRLTYGFASASLTREIHSRIDPSLDQHAACDVNRRGNLICARGGSAVDFLVEDEDMKEVAAWIEHHLPFDRMYYYGTDRPLHVSYGPDHSRQLFEMIQVNGRRVPRRTSFR